MRSSACSLTFDRHSRYLPARSELGRPRNHIQALRFAVQRLNKFKMQEALQPEEETPAITPEQQQEDIQEALSEPRNNAVDKQIADGLEALAGNS